MNPAAEASTIQLRFELQRSALALAINFTAPIEGVTALFGPSGAGKTTCLRVLAGIESIAGAYVRFGKDVWLDAAQKIYRPPHRRALGYVFQDALLFPHLTVTQNLEYGLHRRGARTSNGSIGQVAESLNIVHLLERDARTLSGGEGQRVALARALLSAPRLMLLDEPLASLDAAHKAEILPLLERVIQEYRVPVIYVSHAIEEVVRLADHMVLLESGQVRAQGPTTEVLQQNRQLVWTADKPSCVINGRVAAYDSAFGLLELACSFGIIRLLRGPETVGRRLRVLIRAADVSLSRTEPTETSILNVLTGVVTELASTPDSAQILVTIDAAGILLFALVTRYSCAQLALARGLRIWAQIKAVAVVG